MQKGNRKMEKINFKLVSPAKQLFSGEGEMIIIPAKNGYMGVMKGHVPIIATLDVGTVIVRCEGASDIRLFVEEGFVKITPNEVVVLAENGIDLSNTTREKVQTEIKQANQELAKAVLESEKEFANYRVKIANLKLDAMVNPYYAKS